MAISVDQIDTVIDVTLEEIFGTGISSIVQTVRSDEPGGTNVWTATLTNGNTSNLYVQNGTTSGSPIIASSSSEMTDHTKVYLFVGSEIGFTKGHMYYYKNGWTDAGLYDNHSVLEIVEYPTAPLPPGELEISLQPDKFYYIPSTNWTEIAVSLESYFANNGVMNQYYMRFETGATPPELSFTGIIAPEVDVQANSIYDVFIYYNKFRSQAVAHIWENGTAIGSGGGVSITVDGERAVFE